jgi:four helix bundle protein
LKDCRIAESEGIKEGWLKGGLKEGTRSLGALCARRGLVDKTAEDLKARTKRFVSAVLEFVDTLPPTVAAETLGRQLARAGTGLAGNYRSACRARSHAEFTARMGIAADEADQGELWICERSSAKPTRPRKPATANTGRPFVLSSFRPSRPSRSLLSAILQLCNPAIIVLSP